MHKFSESRLADPVRIDVDQTTGCVYVMDRSLGGKVVRFGTNGTSDTILTMANVLGIHARDNADMDNERYK